MAAWPLSSPATVTASLLRLGGVVSLDDVGLPMWQCQEVIGLCCQLCPALGLLSRFSYVRRTQDVSLQPEGLYLGSLCVRRPPMCCSLCPSGHPRCPPGHLHAQAPCYDGLCSVLCLKTGLRVKSIFCSLQCVSPGEGLFLKPTIPVTRVPHLGARAPYPETSEILAGSSTTLGLKVVRCISGRSSMDGGFHEM